MQFVLWGPSENSCGYMEYGKIKDTVQDQTDQTLVNRQ